MFPATVPTTRQAHDAYQAAHRFSAGALLGIGCAHAVVFWLLAASGGMLLAPQPLNSALMVQMLVPTPPAAPTPTFVPLPAPRAAIAERKPVAPPQAPPPAPMAVLASASESLSAAAHTPAQTPAHSPATSPSPAPSPAPVATPANPAPVSQPRFDANYLLNPAPVYPALSRRLGEEGKVVLRVFVEPDGRPGQLDIKTSSDSPRLDQAALDAVRRWKFVAARRGDEAIGAWVLVPIVFNLKI